MAGGAAPFYYRWTNGDTTANPNNLLPGQYGVTVSDMAGCEYLFSYTVEAGTISTDTPLGETVSIYPNPVSEQLGVRFGDQMAWLLFSPEGKPLVRVERPNGSGQVSVDLGQLPSGHYAFVFVGKDGGFIPGMLLVAR